MCITDKDHKASDQFHLGKASSGLCVSIDSIQKLSSNSLSSRMYIAMDCSPTQSSYLDQLTPLSCSLLNETTDFQGFCILGAPHLNMLGAERSMDVQGN